MEQGIFTEDQEKLSEEAWRLLLRQKSEMEEYREQQKELIQEIFE